tara:strand:- start:184 stop:1065 length:882 start_codon:yes stop_codon:yes gene_type:complete
MTNLAQASSNSKTYHHIQVQPLAGSLGAELLNVDLSRLSEEVFKEIHQALLEYSVIFLRDQTLTPEEHKAFGQRFGTLNIHPTYEPLPGHEEILAVVKEKDAKHNIGDTWHTDVTFLPTPPMGSILYAREIPPYGGDTLFANLSMAYDALSDGMKQMLEGLNAVHSNAYLLGGKDGSEDRNQSRSTKLREDKRQELTAVHPVVRTHPETGRKCLFINEAFTQRFENMTREESQPLIDYLVRHATRPEFTCRFRWEKGSIAFWDNRCTYHYALNDYHGYRREMHRVTINGDRPV